MNIVRRVYNWMENKVDSPYSTYWLAALFFTEAIFFIPVDPLLILFCVSNNKKSLYYATVATLASVAGGITAYFFGAMMWKSVGSKLVTWIISEESFNTAIVKYKLYQNWAVLIAGFTPLPYKAVTLSAGYCNLAFIPFVVFSLVSRGTRFFMVAGAISIWGNSIKSFIDKYFNQLAILFAILVILSVWIFKT